ncbi:MAG TPA: sigma-70 family RNA polymerase sigma factor [Verrucomicrobiae bacterium]|jgi:RNA polymerase sigma-70 factor (ECF subfamily)|nr:sigma-70 family RNA polymerase sigma factor [Verrucomicrobiae bacterium]
MKPKEEELIPTRASLIHRLKNWQDNLSWREFFNVYWKLIYGVARKAGLSDDEAQDVVQETLISVAKHMPTFNYDPSIGSFKGWLLTMTRWRIIGQFRKRRPGADNPLPADETKRTDAVEAIADPNIPDLKDVWEKEWERNLLEVALDNLKRTLDPQRYQIFDFYVNKEWPPEKVAKHFGVSTDQVYQIKHRMTDTIRNEVQRLEKEML